ncbi:MAG: SMI1/KNR4 family protein [Planctomycetota bacterium]
MSFPLEPRCVDAAEAALGVRLPPAYRARMLRENGGELQLVPGDDAHGDLDDDDEEEDDEEDEEEDDGWWLFPLRDDSTPKRLARTWDDVVRQTQLALMQRGVPEGAVAIGHDGSGNLLLLSPRREAAELEACVWDHETGELTWLSVEQLFGQSGRRSEEEFHNSIDCCFPYLDRAAAQALIDEALTISPAAVFDVVHELARRPRSSNVPDAVCLALLDRIAGRVEHPLAAAVISVARRMVAREVLPFPECEALMRRIATFPGQWAALHVVYFACDEPGMADADRLLHEITAAWADGEG